MKVLVIDGERSFLQVMRATLERAGCKVLDARDGLSGLALVRSESFGLVLLNVMPSGLDACRQLRQVSDVPTIMYGSPKPEDVVGALAAGADNHVLQPFSQHELLARVHALMRRAAWQWQAQAVAGAGSQQTLTAFSRNSQAGVVSWNRGDKATVDCPSRQAALWPQAQAGTGRASGLGVRASDRLGQQRSVDGAGRAMAGGQVAYKRSEEREVVPIKPDWSG